VKIGKRLQQLESMVTLGYDHIWDCCCDHGLLGAALLSRQAAPNIHFADIVPDLMIQLEQKLKHFFPIPIEVPASSQWKVHCIDVSTLPLGDFSGNHLVIIAGVGGECMAELVKEIHFKNLTTECGFLLCPVNHTYRLRQQLIELNFDLINESLIVENKRFYEAILVSRSNEKELKPKINPVGSLLWNTRTPQESALTKAYLAKLLAHYTRINLNTNANVQEIIDAYNAVAI
jgi:tRNA (adenine22-N1)-methyltransferase